MISCLCCRVCGRRRRCLPARQRGAIGVKPIALLAAAICLACAAGFAWFTRSISSPYLEMAAALPVLVGVWAFKVLVFRKYLPTIVTHRDSDSDEAGTCEHITRADGHSTLAVQNRVTRANKPVFNMNPDVALPAIPRSLRPRPAALCAASQGPQQLNLHTLDGVVANIAVACNPRPAHPGPSALPQAPSPAQALTRAASLPSAQAVSLQFNTPVVGDTAPWGGAFSSRCKLGSRGGGGSLQQPAPHPRRRPARNRTAKKLMVGSRRHLQELGLSPAALKSLRRAHRHRIAPEQSSPSPPQSPPAAASSPTSPISGTMHSPGGTGAAVTWQENAAPRDHLDERTEKHAAWVRTHYSVPLQGRCSSIGSTGSREATQHRRSRRGSQGSLGSTRRSHGSPPRGNRAGIGCASDSSSSGRSSQGAFSLYEADIALQTVQHSTADLLLPVHRRMRALTAATAEQAEEKLATANCAICLCACGERCVACRTAGLQSSMCGASTGRCGHVLHAHCMDKWRKHCRERSVHTTCPLCKAAW